MSMNQMGFPVVCSVTDETLGSKKVLKKKWRILLGVGTILVSTPQNDFQGVRDKGPVSD